MLSSEIEEYGTLPTAEDWLGLRGGNDLLRPILSDEGEGGGGVGRRLERLGPPARDVEGGEYYEAGIGEGEDEDDKAEEGPGSSAKVAVCVLVATAGVATYLAAQWPSLPAVVRCLVVATYVWLLCAAISIVVQHSTDGGPASEGADGAERRPRDRHFPPCVQVHVPPAFVSVRT